MATRSAQSIASAEAIAQSSSEDDESDEQAESMNSESEAESMSSESGQGIKKRDQVHVKILMETYTSQRKGAFVELKSVAETLAKVTEP